MSRRTTMRAIRLAGLAAIAGAIAFNADGWVEAADHTDSPLVAGDQAADIADVYSFADGDALVLAMTVSNAQAAPQIQLGRSIFDPNVLYQFNIDTNGDAVEDRVIQAVVIGDPENQMARIRGPIAPAATSPAHRLVEAPFIDVAVSTGDQAFTADRNGISVFAGVRDDPFFFDLGQFQAILGGAAGGFNDPGVDSFAGLNVYAIVVRIPLDMLGDPATLSVWGSTARP